MILGMCRYDFSSRTFNSIPCLFSAKNCLIEGIGSKKSVLMSKLQNSVINKTREVWREFTAKVNSLGVALRTEDDLYKSGKILNLRYLNTLRDQGKVGGRPPSRPPLYADIIMDTIGEGTDVTMGIDRDQYSYLVKRMITVCGVCCTFKYHLSMDYSLFTTVSSLVK